MAYTWIKSPGTQIAGGSKVDLRANTFNYSFNTFLSEQPIPSRDTGSQYPDRLHKVDYMGFANPNIVIQGIMFGSGPKVLTNSEGSVAITTPLFGSFCMFGSPFWFGEQDNGVLNSVGSERVMAESFKVNKTSQSEIGRADYTLNLKVTKEW